MLLNLDEESLDKFILIGDRLLIKPKKDDTRTKGGLYLPPGVQEKRKIQSGYVIKAGPGYPIPAPVESDEPWKDTKDNIKYFPLQALPGDLAIFLLDSSFEIEFKKEKYYILPHSAVLMVVRDEDLVDG